MSSMSKFNKKYKRLLEDQQSSDIQKIIDKNTGVTKEDGKGREDGKVTPDGETLLHGELLTPETQAFGNAPDNNPMYLRPKETSGEILIKNSPKLVALADLIDNADNPEEVYNSLTPEQQKAYQDFIQTPDYKNYRATIGKPSLFAGKILTALMRRGIMEPVPTRQGVNRISVNNECYEYIKSKINRKPLNENSKKALISTLASYTLYKNNQIKSLLNEDYKLFLNIINEADNVDSVLGSTLKGGLLGGGLGNIAGTSSAIAYGSKIGSPAIGVNALGNLAGNTAAIGAGVGGLASGIKSFLHNKAYDEKVHGSLLDMLKNLWNGPEADIENRAEYLIDYIKANPGVTAGVGIGLAGIIALIWKLVAKKKNSSKAVEESFNATTNTFKQVNALVETIDINSSNKDKANVIKTICEGLFHDLALGTGTGALIGAAGGGLAGGIGGAKLGHELGDALAWTDNGKREYLMNGLKTGGIGGALAGTIDGALAGLTLSAAIALVRKLFGTKRNVSESLENSDLPDDICNQIKELDLDDDFYDSNIWEETETYIKDIVNNPEVAQEMNVNVETLIAALIKVSYAKWKQDSQE